ncbi:MAG: hypothetical protein QXF36_06180 [Candidatus Caldarchaeum sp.]
MRTTVLTLILFTALALHPATADPAYGLLRTYTDQGSRIAQAYDIEVDRDGIYIVGLSNDRYNKPALTILNSDHTLRCSTRIDEPSSSSVVQGVAMTVEINQTYVFVAGILSNTPDSRTSFKLIYVAALRKNDCSLVEPFYTIDLTSLSLGLRPFSEWSEGIDLAVDDTGVYLLVGLFIFDNRGFLILKLDHSLQYVTHKFIVLSTPNGDFGMSIALGDQSLYVAGIMGFDPSTFSGNSLFVSKFDKTSLTLQNTVNLGPSFRDVFFAGLEMVVDENNDIYVVQTQRTTGNYDSIVVDKLDSNMNSIWKQAYLIDNVYMDSSLSLPQHILLNWTYGVTAAVSDSYLFIGGFTTNFYVNPKGGENPVHGLVLAVSRFDGEAQVAFRIRGQRSPDNNVQVIGVDAFDDCVYLAGYSDYYRLEYVLLNLNNQSLSPSLVAFPVLSRPPSQEMRNLDFKLTSQSWSPVFDQDGASSYALYGILCPGSLTRQTTTTSTSTVTSTATETTTSTSVVSSTTTLTSTRISRFTVTSTSTELVQETVTVPSTVYTTYTEYSTERVSQTVFETVRTIVTDRFQAPQIITVYDGAGATTATVFRNTTTTATLQLTTTVRGEVNWLELPPWFYLPFFLLPLPLVAVLLNNRRVKIIINRSEGPLTVWSHGDEPLVEDIYMTPSIASVKKGAKITFVNKDNVPHVIEAYEGPAEYLFTSEEIKPGGKWRHKLEAPGIYRVRSITKPYMGCIIRVED